MRSIRIRGCTAAAAALAALALAAPAQALLFHLPEGFSSGVYGKVRVWVEPDDGPIQVVADTRLDPDPVTYGQFVLSVANEAGLNSAATVVGRVGRGYAQLDAIAIARQQGSEARSYATVHAGAAFGDVLTVSAPGLGGTSGTIRLGVRLHGALSAASNGWDADIEAIAYGGAVVFGVTEARFLELRDAQGAPVTDFEVASLSGTDYRDPIVPVPEPGTSLPALAPLVALAWRRR